MRKAKDGCGSMADIVCGRGGFCVNFDLFFFFFGVIFWIRILLLV